MKKIALGIILAASAALMAASPLEYATVKTTFKNGKTETARVRLAVPAGRDLSGCRVVVDPDDTLCELYESNNTLPL